ncbi:MAG: DUF192 domain-containing protein [Candidatus Paceibacterota bacterium]|jgi:hypothetical protein
MRQYAYVVLLVVVAGVAGWFFYRTETPPATSLLPTATFGGVSLRIELATTTADRDLGLGGRDSVPDNYGMLFVFPKDDLYGFWMKDMLVPIDIFWLAPDVKGQIGVVSMETGVATSSYPDVFYPSTPARYVLETYAGFARDHSIATGTTFLLKNTPIVSEWRCPQCVSHEQE